MTSTFGNYINGEWVASSQDVANLNPSDISDEIGRFANATLADVDAAVAAAKAAFPAWSRTAPHQRGLILKKTAAQLEARARELGELLAREEGKTLAEATGEVMRAAQVFDFFAAETVRISGEMLSALRPGVTAEITREPIGVVGIITPWNFPIAIPAWKIASALAYGNCAVFKPSELVPASAHALVHILADAGVPAGVLNLVMGDGPVVGQRLTDHADIAAITFTGSVPTGRHIARAAVSGITMKKLQLELGGKNPLVVLDDADLVNAIDVAVDGAFFATGQRCTASSRFIVTEGIHDRFVEGVKERLASLRVGHALHSDTNIGPVVDQRQLDIDLGYIEVGRSEGARLAFGGERLERPQQGFYLAPTLFVDASPEMRICREEIFGPVAAVIRVQDYEEALAIANETPFGLSSGICTTSLKYAEHFKRNSETGMVKVNLATTGADFHLPGGGGKASGYGPPEQGRYAQQFFTELKTSYQLAL